MLSPDSFYKKYLNKSIDIDRAAGAQCVDLFKAFTKDNYNIYNYNTGNGFANGLWLNRKSKPYYDKFIEVSLNDIQNGDWVIWDKKAKDCPDSHVAMYYNHKFFGQNQKSIKKCTLTSISTDKVLGVLRPKAYIKNSNNYKIKYVYNCKQLNVRNNINGVVVNTIYEKTALKVYEVVNNWARVEKNIWVSNNYLTSSKPANHIKSMEVYNCINLNVRNFPNKKVVGSIPVNCVVSVLAEKNGWVKIGNERWVYKKYLK